MHTMFSFMKNITRVLSIRIPTSYENFLPAAHSLLVEVRPLSEQSASLYSCVTSGRI